MSLRPGDIVPIAWEERRYRGPRRNVRVRWTGERRPAKAGEWFISGGPPEGYIAYADHSGRNDLIGELVTIRETIEVTGIV